MAKERCPSCGAPYNGKKCRACCYQCPPSDIPRPEVPAPALSKTAKNHPKTRQKSAFRSLLGFLILLLLIALLLPGLRTWGQELKSIADAQAISGPMYPSSIR